MSSKLQINVQPQFKLSPRLYMQFMEPLGTTDASVEAAWDFFAHTWRPEFIDVVRELAPGCIRWGGIYASFWKWREGIGPRDKRIMAHNYLWGGVETSQVGLHEIVELCKLVAAEPLMCINFAADGRPEYITTPNGDHRAGDATEAADMVSYCNDPDHAERIANGAIEPFNIKLWQIGNETSYPPAGGRFSSEENVANYLDFAEAMRARDETIELIGWGGVERGTGEFWAADLINATDGLLDYVAIHMMNQSPLDTDTHLFGREYMRDREQAWEELQLIYKKVVDKLETAIQIVKATGSTAKLAITEGHLSLRPHNVNLLLHEWLAGLYYARVMNLFERHGDMVEISTLADFFGTRWTVNAVMLGGPRQNIYLMPAGVIMKLFKQYGGEEGLDIPSMVGSLDLSASRTNNKVYVHAVNINLQDAQDIEIDLPGETILSAKVLEIAPGDLGAYVDHDHIDTFEPVESEIGVEFNRLVYKFKPASVNIMIIELSDQTVD